MSVSAPTRWTLFARQLIRPVATQVLFRLRPGTLLIARDLRGNDGRMLSELVVPHRLPELVDADFERDDPLHDLLDGLAGVFWGEYGLGSQGDPRDELYVLHRYPTDRREDVPRRTAVAVQAFHTPTPGAENADEARFPGGWLFPERCG